MKFKLLLVAAILSNTLLGATTVVNITVEAMSVHSRSPVIQIPYDRLLLLSGLQDEGRYARVVEMTINGQAYNVWSQVGNAPTVLSTLKLYSKERGHGEYHFVKALWNDALSSYILSSVEGSIALQPRN